MTSTPPEAFTGRLKEVAAVFLTFGGPAARIAMMRRELVTKRHWV